MALRTARPAEPESAHKLRRKLGAVADSIASIPGAQAELREYMADRWEAWLDERIPALRDQTPREATRTPLGRELLEAPLHDYEWNSGRLPHQAFGPDVAALRSKLGL